MCRKIRTDSFGVSAGSVILTMGVLVCCSAGAVPTAVQSELLGDTESNPVPGRRSTGACCTPFDSEGCWEGVDEDFCFNSYNGSAWYEGFDCTDPNPCRGACCLPGGGCTAPITQTDCVNSGGLFLGGEIECPPDGCCSDWPPPFTGGDECWDASSAGVLPYQSPLDILGDNLLASGPDACAALAPDPVWWESVTLTECSDLMVSFCCTAANLACIGGDFHGAPCTGDVDCDATNPGRCFPIVASAYTVIYDGCPCSDGQEHHYDNYPGPGGTTGENFTRDECPGGFDGPDPSPTIYWRNLPAGTYYYPIVSDDNLRNVYNLTFASSPPTDPAACGSEPELDSQYSCAEHGGDEICLELGEGDAKASGDNIESRLCAGSQFKVTFTGHVSDLQADVSCAVDPYWGTAVVTNHGLSADIVVTPPLPDEDCCTIMLSGSVSDQFTVRMLRGDVDCNGQVRGSDMLICKPFTGQSANEYNCRCDMDCNGEVRGSDSLAIKPYIGNSAPPCP